MQNNEIKNQINHPTSSVLNIKRSIAITGATGFIGKRLLDQLITHNWDVRALCRARKGRVQTNTNSVEWLVGELNDDDTLDRLVHDVDYVIHCAGAVRGANRADFDTVNEAGALRIAKAVARQSAPPKFLLLSSLAAREPQLSNYAGSKFRGEQAIKSVLTDYCWTIFRPPAVFGPGDKELLPLFQSIAKGIAPLPAGKGRRFSMIFVDDLVSAILSWITNNIGYGQTYELDDGQTQGYDWNKVLQISSQVLRNGAKVHRIPIPIILLKLSALANLGLSKILGYAPMLTPGKVREITHNNWLCNSAEFIRISGWQPQYKLEKGLNEIFNLNSAKFKVS